MGRKRWGHGRDLLTSDRPRSLRLHSLPRFGSNRVGHRRCSCAAPVDSGTGIEVAPIGLGSRNRCRSRGLSSSVVGLIMGIPPLVIGRIGLLGGGGAVGLLVRRVALLVIIRLLRGGVGVVTGIISV